MTRQQEQQGEVIHPYNFSHCSSNGLGGSATKKGEKERDMRSQTRETVEDNAERKSERASEKEGKKARTRRWRSCQLLRTQRSPTHRLPDVTALDRSTSGVGLQWPASASGLRWWSPCSSTWTQKCPAANTKHPLINIQQRKHEVREVNRNEMK